MNLYCWNYRRLDGIYSKGILNTLEILKKNEVER